MLSGLKTYPSWAVLHFFSGRNPNGFTIKDHFNPHFSAYGSFNQMSNMNLNYKSAALPIVRRNIFSHLLSTKKWPASLLSFCCQWADIFFSLSYNIRGSLSRTKINCKPEHRISCPFPFLFLKKSNCSSLVSPLVLKHKPLGYLYWPHLTILSQDNGSIHSSTSHSYFQCLPPSCY